MKKLEIFLYTHRIHQLWLLSIVDLIVGKKEYLQVLDKTFFSFTYGGDCIGLSAAKICIPKMKHEKVSDHLWKVGELFRLSVELYDVKKSQVLWSDHWEESWKNLPLIKEQLSNSLLAILNQKYQY